jgi:pimeloyl-ACP methyl ester carboxylesterase/DNA-binding CsgD family transcriptional regulator
MEAPPVEFARTSDGYNIAYTATGTGFPFVFMPSGVSHVLLAWSGSLGPWFRSLSERFRLINFDSRGQGLSTRGLPASFPFTDFSRDLEAIVEHLRLDRFVLLGSSQFSHIAVRYALERPERVRALVLVHAAVSMHAYPIPLWRDVAKENWDFFLQTIALARSSQALAEATERYGQMTTQADWLASVRAFSDSVLSGLLPRLTVPTLVLHARDFPHLQVDEAARLAALVPGARLCLTEGGEPFTRLEQALPAIEAFLSDHPEPVDPPSYRLSQREVEVLRLVATGRTNQQIAEELVISGNTVRRHLSNIFNKIGAANRAQAAVIARDNLIL